MSNLMKPGTPDTIKELQEAHINCIMATGDNVLTAISIAKQSYILSGSEELFICEKDTSGQIVIHKYDSGQSQQVDTAG